MRFQHNVARSRGLGIPPSLFKNMSGIISNLYNDAFLNSIDVSDLKYCINNEQNYQIAKGKKGTCIGG